MSRNKVMWGVGILILIAGLFIYKLMPNDSQKIHTFQSRFMQMQTALNVNVAEFQHSYQIAQGTHTLRTLYIDAMHLNMAANYILKLTPRALDVPSLKNKVAQANLQQAHDLYIAYLQALITLSQNTVNTAQRSGFVAQLPALNLPTTDNVAMNIASAYMVLNKPAK